jgi:dienelactone hydrolase
LFVAALLAIAAGCASDDDDAQSANTPKKDAGADRGGLPGHGGRRFEVDGQVLELDEAGRPIPADASSAPAAMQDAGARAGGDASTPPQPTFDVPDDPGARGPWAVGVRTLQVDLGAGKLMPAEVWYPAEAQSEAGHDKVVYDMIDVMPPEVRDVIGPEDKPLAFGCDCYRDLPIDGEHGPYPVAIVVHDWGGGRIEAAHIASHWASRGFIAIAADHPRLLLSDWWALVGEGCSGSTIGEDLSRTRDVPAELASVRDGAGDWAFAAAHADLTRVAVAGRFLGAEFAAAMSGTAGVRLIMLWGSPLVPKIAGDLAEVVYVTGKEPSVYTDSFATVKSGFDKTSQAIKPAVLVGITGATQTPTPFCDARTPSDLDGAHLQSKYDLCKVDLTDLIGPPDCSLGFVSQEQADAIFAFVTTAALEEALRGADPSAVWRGFDPTWGELIEAR